MIISMVAAHKTHAILVIQVSSRGRPRQSRVPMFLTLPTLSPLTQLLPPGCEGRLCQYGTASEEPVSVTDEKPTLISVGLMGQVASSLPYPPSSHDEVTERPGWQPRGLPDLPNFR
ncbi:MAG: hypothetical protein Nkreftii_000527 [Candidatus Nitrospira kreftii]|uniref:Uncharacterized protein n=1 Tax=Candidatus Nitrospira kreftii TaxID=2652173 RepID=A0A7S8FBE8_9BACT|nr:MAG: hypothetical protein Nkreftii_000527 [Candidatus Nitrospira kreftii]